MGLAVLVAVGFLWLGPWLGLAFGGVLLFGAGIAACEVSMLAKWLLVGRFRAIERPLWSSFVWRTELADTFVEVLAVPWFVPATQGTPLLSVWLRALGASIERVDI